MINHVFKTYSAASRIDFSWTWYEKMKNASDEFTLNKLIKMKDIN